MTFSRSLLGIVIAAAVSAVVPNVRAESADPRATAITVPNKRVVRYNLAAGGSPCIGLPANVTVLAMGVELTLNRKTGRPTFPEACRNVTAERAGLVPAEPGKAPRAGTEDLGKSRRKAK
jgi:hypothetical protein